MCMCRSINERHVTTSCLSGTATDRQVSTCSVGTEIEIRTLLAIPFEERRFAFYSGITRFANERTMTRSLQLQAEVHVRRTDKLHTACSD